MNKGLPLRQSDYLRLDLSDAERLHCDQCPSSIKGEEDIAAFPAYVGVQHNQIIHILCSNCWDKLNQKEGG